MVNEMFQKYFFAWDKRLDNQITSLKASLSTAQVDRSDFFPSQRLQFFDMPQSNKKTIEKLIGISREIGLYSEEPSKNISPIEYWKQNSSVYPGLFFCDKPILCIQGSSVPSEQLFSHTSYCVWDRRNTVES